MRMLKLLKKQKPAECWANVLDFCVDAEVSKWWLNFLFLETESEERKITVGSKLFKQVETS